MLSQKVKNFIRFHEKLKKKILRLLKLMAYYYLKVRAIIFIHYNVYYFKFAESLYQNVRATADNSHERSINTFPSFVKSSHKEIEDEYEV